MSQFIEQLKQHLSQDLSDLDKLTELLRSEKELLKTRDHEAIQRTAKHKSELVGQIEQRSKTKAKLIASSGLGIKPGHVEASLSKLGDSELIELWKASRSKMELCKERNQVNGSIISRSLQRTNKLMSIIRGQNRNENLYSQQGKEQSLSGRHSIGKA